MGSTAMLHQLSGSSAGDALQKMGGDALLQRQLSEQMGDAALLQRELSVTPFPPTPPPSPPSVPLICSNDCPKAPEWGFDGLCDDGGEGAKYNACDYGTDCSDCGVRVPQPPAPPAAPPYGECGVCDAGEVCGICLELVPTSECPSVPGYNSLPLCYAPSGASSWPEPGGLCSGFNECGTSTSDNNCPYQTSSGEEASQPPHCLID